MNKKRTNATDEAAIRKRGRPKDRKDVSDSPRYERNQKWAQNNADFAALVAFLHKQKDTLCLKDLAMATGYSIPMCSIMLKRTGYRFHLRSYTFQLSEQQKAYRKQMCIDFEKAVFELPTFIEVRIEILVQKVFEGEMFHVISGIFKRNIPFRPFGGRTSVKSIFRKR